MKKIILSVLIGLATISSFAQNQHLSFKGVPIDGTLKAYTEAMKAKGFSFLGSQDGMSVLQGDFAGYKGCTIGVSTLQNRDLVSKIAVIFRPLETWSLLFDNYSNLKNMLSTKYGAPSDCLEIFDSSYQPDNDNSRMHEVRMDRCKYSSIFTTEKGTIELLIAHSDLGCFVLLKYSDKINSEIVMSDAMEDL